VLCVQMPLCGLSLASELAAVQQLSQGQRELAIWLFGFGAAMLLLLTMVECRAWQRGRGLAAISVLLEGIAMYWLNQRVEFIGLGVLGLGLGCLVLAVVSSDARRQRPPALAPSSR